MKQSWVYILQCADGRYYTGCTTNLDQRINQHQTGQLKGFTSTRLPVTVVFTQTFSDINDAIHAERQIKRWSRAKKEALIRGDFEMIRMLARKNFEEK